MRPCNMYPPIGDCNVPEFRKCPICVDNIHDNRQASDAHSTMDVFHDALTLGDIR